MSKPLPHQWLPGSDTPNSLAQAVQENFDALAVETNDQPAARMAAKISVAVSLTPDGTPGAAGATTVTLPASVTTSGIGAVAGGFQGATGAIDRLTWGWQPSGTNQVIVSYANNFAGNSVTGTLVLLVYI